MAYPPPPCPWWRFAGEAAGGAGRHPQPVRFGSMRTGGTTGLAVGGTRQVRSGGRLIFCFSSMLLSKGEGGAVQPGCEVRHLPQRVVNQLCRILDVASSWKTLMGAVTDHDRRIKYTSDDVRLVEEASVRMSRSPTSIFLNEWGTSGRKRPTASTLLSILSQLELFRASDYLSQEVLGLGPAPRPLTGPSAPVDTSIDLRIIGDGSPSRVSYDYLCTLTDDFSDVPVRKGGRLLGSGAFGSVHLGILPSGERVAVKKLFQTDASQDRNFQSEVDALSRFHHENIVPLLGYSDSGINWCLVYAFMPGGSLQDRLSCLDALPPLTWRQRIRIASGTAKGLAHLHVGSLVHRDVKSANVLLNADGEAHIGDFGLARTGPRGQSTATALASTVFGTSAYMAPEAFRGDVSAKMDVFSYGVVLLEILTGLLPYDENRDGCDLVTHVEEVCPDGASIVPLLDSKAGDWPQEAFTVLFSTSQKCLEEKKTRPTMEQVLGDLAALDDIVHRMSSVA